MPELPEVETTVDGLNKTVKGLKIIGVWTEYHNVSQVKKDDIKNPKFFLYFRKMVKEANKQAKALKKSITVESKWYDNNVELGQPAELLENNFKKYK